MTATDEEFTDFIDALDMLATYAAESPLFSQRGIPESLERVRNVVADLQASQIDPEPLPQPRGNVGQGAE